MTSHQPTFLMLMKTTMMAFSVEVVMMFGIVMGFLGAVGGFGGLKRDFRGIE